MEGTINEFPNIPGFIERYKPSFPVGMADPQDARHFMEIPQFTQAFVPFMAIIDREGNVRAQYTGSDRDFFNDDLVKQTMNIREAVEKYLTPPPKAAPTKRPVRKTTK